MISCLSEFVSLRLFFLLILQCEKVDMDQIFGNMVECVDVSQTLLISLESCIMGRVFEEQIIGKFSYIF